MLAVVQGWKAKMCVGDMQESIVYGRLRCNVVTQTAALLWLIVCWTVVRGLSVNDALLRKRISEPIEASPWSDHKARDPIACSPATKPRVLTDYTGWFTSPNYPDEYPVNNFCDWRILSQENDGVVQLDFEFFATEVQYDYLYVRDGNFTTSPIIAGFDGSLHNPAPKNVRSTGPAMYVQFFTDQMVVDVGFNVTYTSAALDLSPDPCYRLTRPLILTGYNGSFQLNGYPHSYWNMQNCYWLIQSPEPGTLVQVEFNFFATEPNYDYLDILDGNNTSAPTLATLSGRYSSGVPGTFNSTGENLFLRFSSDQLVNDRGFQGIYRTIQTTKCGTSLRVSANETVISQGYDVMCEIDVTDQHLFDTACYDLVQNLYGFGGAAGLVSKGGNFGCSLSTRQDNIGAENACFDNFQWQAKLGNCLSCTKMFVCIRFT